MPTDRTYLYAERDDVEAILSAYGVDMALDDQKQGVPSGNYEEHLNRALQWASARVDFYANGQYSRRGLSGSWLVNEWAAIIAAVQLRRRRGNPVPGALMDRYKEALEDLKMVQSGQVVMSDVSPRAAHWPAWSNVRVDHTYELRKVRVERWISERASGEPGYSRDADISAEYIPPPL